MRISPLRLVSAVLLSTLPSIRTQSVLVVDASDPTAFASPAAAVAAASPGDTILVHAGTYFGPVVLDKTLSLVADEGAFVQLNEPVQVTQLTTGEHVVLRGLRIRPVTVTAQAPPLVIVDCAGPVWVQDCALFGNGSFSQNSDALAVSNSPDVAFLDGTILADDSPGLLAPGGNGATIVDSTVHFFNSTVTGGLGEAGGVTPPTIGGAGIAALDSVVYLQGSTVNGGAGGSGVLPFGCLNGARGGEGVALAGGSAELRLLASTVQGGDGGASTGSCAPGNDGLGALPLNGATIELLEGPSYPLATESSVREGGTLTFALSGPPGDTVFLCFSALPSYFYFPATRGPLLLDLGLFLGFPLGTLSPSGTLSVPVSVPEVGAGFEGALLYAQIIALNPVFNEFVGSARAILVLDRSF